MMFDARTATLAILLAGLGACHKRGQTEPPAPEAFDDAAAVVAEQPAMDIDGWLKKYAAKPADISKSFANLGGHGGWFDGKSAEVAENYFTHWGPLGIRTRMLDGAWGHEPAFRARWPQFLLSKDGELMQNAFEVVEVWPGSPADGQLQAGDLLLEMDGQAFLTATDLPHAREWRFLDSRSLEVHAGELLDRAEGRGEVRFKVLRAGTAKPAAADDVPTMWVQHVARQFRNDEDRKQALELRLQVTGGERVRLTVTDGGNGNGSDGFDWKGMYFQGTDAGGVPKRLALHQLAARKRTTGWSQIRTDPATGDWWVHAHSELEFAVPDGEWTLVGKGLPSGGGTVDALVAVAPAMLPLPQRVAAQCQEVRFAIPRVGSFAKDFPTGCAKSVNIIATTCGWLARQQRDDGSWPRPSGYTSNHYDTAWAVLALMSTGDSQYDANVRKAAQWLAYQAPHDKWAVPAATVILALSEYWLKFRDDGILPGLEIWVDRCTRDMVYGDYTTGHGNTPGYAGGGVSVGGSALTVALAVASKTPVRVPAGLVDRMLARAQELGADGFIPYGRGTANVKFSPELESGAAYSGRHGPYLRASRIHGGPRIFTENAAAMYTKGPIGGIDQGHATKTLSLMWAFPAVAAEDTAAYHRHLEALKWQITMNRAFDGGFVNNSYRLEFQGGESLLGGAIRTACWVIALTAERKQLAITGKPAYQASTLSEVLPTTHRDASMHRYYHSNWAVVAAALGTAAPERLKAGARALREMPKGEGLHDRIYGLLSREAMPVATELLALQSGDPRDRQYFAEMVLGIDHRIQVIPAKDANGKPVAGAYELSYTAQHPQAGRGRGQTQDQIKAWRGQSWPMTGTVTFDGGGLSAPLVLTIDASKGIDWDGMHTQDQKQMLALDPAAKSIRATIHCQVGGLAFHYTRDLELADPENWGSGEKGRIVSHDRQVWVQGTLLQDQAGWNCSFRLPFTGDPIAASTQGGELRVLEGDAAWISPQVRTLTAGSRGAFLFSSGWQDYEGRVSQFRLEKSGSREWKPVRWSRDGQEQPWPDAWCDGKLESALTLPLAAVAATDTHPARNSLLLELDFGEARAVRGLDWRMKSPLVWWAPACRVSVHGLVDGIWKALSWGQSHGGGDFTPLVPVTTQRLRVEISHPDNKQLELGELRIYGSD